MTKVKCPQGHDLELMSATDVVSEVRARGWSKFSQNYLATLKKKGKFPEPWVTVANRDVWLKDQFETWWDNRAVEARDAALEKAAQTLIGLKGRDLDKAFAELRKRIESNGG